VLSGIEGIGTGELLEILIAEVCIDGVDVSNYFVEVEQVVDSVGNELSLNEGWLDWILAVGMAFIDFAVAVDSL